MEGRTSGRLPLEAVVGAGEGTGVHSVQQAVAVAVDVGPGDPICTALAVVDDSDLVHCERAVSVAEATNLPQGELDTGRREIDGLVLGVLSEDVGLERVEVRAVDLELERDRVARSTRIGLEGQDDVSAELSFCYQMQCFHSTVPAGGVVGEDHLERPRGEDVDAAAHEELLVRATLARVHHDASAVTAGLALGAVLCR